MSCCFLFSIFSSRNVESIHVDVETILGCVILDIHQQMTKFLRNFRCKWSRFMSFGLFNLETDTLRVRRSGELERYSRWYSEKWRSIQNNNKKNRVHVHIANEIIIRIFGEACNAQKKERFTLLKYAQNLNQREFCTIKCLVQYWPEVLIASEFVVFIIRFFFGLRSCGS